jgi:prophage maintenance system killer protein
LIRPTVNLAIDLNHSVREEDEWFDEPDDLERLDRAVASIDEIEECVEAAAMLMFRIARAQAFGEANKRTALLVARWVLDRNGVDGSVIIPPEDRVIADLLIQAAAGQDVESNLLEVFRSRSEKPADT